MPDDAIGLAESEVDRIRRLASRHGILQVQLFGSRARSHGRTDSDVDLLVDLAPGRDLLDLIAFKQDVEEALGCVADVVTRASLGPYLRDQVLAEAKPL
jgi:predicted nucleotidyltransferase